MKNLIALVFLGLMLLHSQTGWTQNKMYWTDVEADKIQRANLDGSSVEDLVTTPLGDPLGIALDVAAGKMYWTDPFTDKIQRAGLDGSSVEDLVTTGLSNPYGIALDVAAGKMYWADEGADKIQRANLDGSSVEDLVTGLSNPSGIALDVAAGKMYWTDEGTDKIQRANLDGSSVEDLVTTGLSFPFGIALDVAAGKMYWTEGHTDKIQRANLDGTSVEDLVTGLSFPQGIALDVAAGKMYWTDPGNLKIQRANLDGTSVEDLITTGFNFPIGIALDVSVATVKPFVFLANKVTLKSTKQSTPAGDIHSNGTLVVEKGKPSTYNSNLFAVGKITINKQNTINGNVKSQASISNSGTITGTKTIGSVANEPLPNLSYSAGGVNKTVPSNGSLTLAPGSYGIVTMSNGGTLKLTSGEYFMNELRYSSSIEGGRIEIDLLSGDPITVNVVTNLQLGNEAAVVLLPNGESDSDLVTFNTMQSTAANWGREAYLLGSFNAPSAVVTLVKNTQLRGSICAKEVLVSNDCLFLHHDSPGSLPGPGNLPKSSFDEEETASDQSTVISYKLEQNYPNPFNPSTTISFALPQASEVSLSIFNTNGQFVKKLVAGEMNAGNHNFTWDATNERGERVASGVYLYVIKAGEFTAQRKLVVMK
jgi:sugar lactone lactonase YvrE